jgi:ABC-type polysaccharide/polyol phosphate transport system ATPase subunit
VVGIIGRNGAGKSTLLKVLSRITKPTGGEVRLRGRVACLIEVGTGFHPEMTGRENVFLNGAILGMTKAEVRSKFDEIAAFAEIDRFLDTPVKRYSTGMRLRLGFAVAAHLEPEILLVDEVLAVGDAAFQKKCLGKMNELSHAEGRSVLYVSHDLASVAALCSRAMLLKDGQIAATGAPDEVIRAYTGMLRDHSTLEIRTPFSSDILDVLSIRLTPDSGPPVTVASNVSVETVVRWKQPQAGVACEIFFSTADGRATFAAYSSQVSAVPGVQRFCWLHPARKLQ